jgi:heme ABC exporter ATP-binding subunit CcmA
VNSFEPAAIDLAGVTRRFGRRWVLRGVDLVVRPGEAVALMGRNGSGKTTLLRVISTLIRPTHGGGTLFGHDLVAQAGEIREFIGLLGHHAGLYEDLTAEENLRFSLHMAGLPWRPADTARVLEQVSLLQERNERVRGFSAGMRRRLAFGRLLLRPPKLLLLDEPYAAFDQFGIDLINSFAREITERGGAALIATHDYSRARQTVHRAIRVEQGRVLEGIGEMALSPDDEAVPMERS